MTAQGRADPPTVLLLEDHPDTSSMMRWTLEQAGYVVVTARDGETAFRLCLEHERAIDLLIADILVPGINGLDLAQVVQRQRPQIKVLLCSGEYLSIKAGLDSLEPGTPFLKKPFDAETLLTRVRQALGDVHDPTEPARPRVLLVEDDKATLVTLTKLLQQHGYHVVAASNGEEAMTSWREQPADILVTDVVMPKMSGTELARQLRAQKSDLPVLYISGLLPQGSVLGSKPERETFLPKPVTGQQLGAKIERLLHSGTVGPARQG